MSAEEFWIWFAVVAERLEQGIDNDRVDDGLVDQLDRAVLSLGDFGWEIGPIENGYMLTVSPGGDPDLLARSEDLIRGAPRLARWTFLSSKPKKQDWDLRFLVYDEAGREFDFDGSTCEFKIEMNDGMRRVLLRGPSFGFLPFARRHDAAGILLDGLLGEARRLTRVPAYEVVPADGASSGWQPIARLEEDIQ